MLNERFVLTAAHCVTTYGVPVPAENFEVKLGAHHLKTSGKMFKVRHVFSHTLYSSAAIRNDIALLKLTSHVEFSTTIAPVCLPHPSKKHIQDGTPVTVSGWGATKFQGDMIQFDYQVAHSLIFVF